MDCWWKGQSSTCNCLPKFLPSLLHMIFAVIPLCHESAHLSKANLPFEGWLELCGYNFPCSSHILWKRRNLTFLETYWISRKAQSADFALWECESHYENRWFWVWDVCSPPRGSGACSGSRRFCLLGNSVYMVNSLSVLQKWWQRNGN